MTKGHPGELDWVDGPQNVLARVGSTLQGDRTKSRVIRNIIFDWSGTLVDDLPAVWAASNHLFEQAGVEPLSLDQFRDEFQLPWEPFFRRYLSHVPREELHRQFRQRFSQMQETVVPLPYAREFLEFCRAGELRTFVLSAVMPEMFALQAASTGFEPYLGRRYLGVHDKRLSILGLLSEGGLDPAETLFIGDMQHDVETAKHGNVQSVAVLTGYNSLGQLREAAPDLIVEHLGELQTILQRNGMRLRPEPTVGGVVPHRLPVATVGALIFNEQGEVLMVRTNKWSNRWGIPGGKIEWGETSEDALRREIREETNLAIEDIRFVMVQDAIHPPEFYRDAHFLLLNYTCIARGQQSVRLNSEAQQFQWITLARASELDLNIPTRILVEAVVRTGSSVGSNNIS